MRGQLPGEFEQVVMLSLAGFEGEATGREIYDVITNGKGLMSGYAYPIRPADRWAIISHVRLLQAKAREAEAALASNR